MHPDSIEDASFTLKTGCPFLEKVPPLYQGNQGQIASLGEQHCHFLMKLPKRKLGESRGPIFLRQFFVRQGYLLLLLQNRHPHPHTSCH